MKKQTNSTLEWKDYELFTIDDINVKMVEVFIKKGFLSDTGKPVVEKLSLEAENLANKLADRLGGNSRMCHFGLLKIANNIKKIRESGNLTELYFYIAYLYGAVYWHTPYNLQRLLAVPEALSIFMGVFSGIIITRLEYLEEMRMAEAAPMAEATPMAEDVPVPEADAENSKL